MASSKAKQNFKSSSWLCGMKKKSHSLTSEDYDSIIHEADDYLESLITSKTFSGSVLLARDNQILLIKGYGCSEYIFKEKNTSQTIYRLGSVTKPFTAILILKLNERKELNLNNKLSVYYPDYPHGNQITIKHLLSNTSGIQDYTEMEMFEDLFRKNLTTDQLIDTFKNEPLKFKPGSEYSYSNSNFILLGFIIEKVTGKSYETNLREFILQPCSMKDTGFECNNDCDHSMDSRHACGYSCSKDSNGFESCRFINMSSAAAAGGIFSTVEDLYRLDRFLYGEKIVNNKTKNLMFKPIKGEYALGWEIPKLNHGRISQRHNGQIFGFTSCLARFPNDNACIIILSNFEETLIEEMLELLTGILFQENNKSYLSAF